MGKFRIQVSAVFVILAMATTGVAGWYGCNSKRSWDKYPCQNNVRVGCENGYCWIQCGALSYEYCYPYPDGDYLYCKNHRDCVQKKAGVRGCGNQPCYPTF